MAPATTAALEQLLRSRWIRRADPRPHPPAAWNLGEISGRLVELSAWAQGATLTVASGLVLEAQRLGEPTAWITGPDTFFPPDLQASGIDLAALAVIRVHDPNDARRAADRLLRSGSFGLLVLDLASFPDDRPPELSLPAQTRLAGLAQRHDAALVCLTRRREEEASLGSLVTLHARTERRPLGHGRYSCGVRVVKDKRRGPGWRFAEVCRGPPGLR